MSRRTEARPPRLSRKILEKVLHAHDREYALSDLEEEFGERCGRNGATRARWWYRRQVMMSLVPALRGRFVKRANQARAITDPSSVASLLSNLGSDVRISLRTLIKTPLVLVVTVLSLGVGIGVVTVAFALVNDLIVRPPVGLDAPKGLVTIYRSQDNGRRYGGSSLPDYTDVVGELDALAGVAAITERSLAMDGPIPPVPVFAEGVSLNYFLVTGIQPVLGRVFTPSEAEGLAAPRVVVLGYDLWMGAFSGSADVVGTSVRINALPFTVIGQVTIVYSTASEGAEYRRYVEFLQNKGYFAPGLDELELEDLPGISGLKALRVTIASESESGETVPRARPSAREIERVLAADRA
jgi:hypothetical protein